MRENGEQISLSLQELVHAVLPTSLLGHRADNGQGWSFREAWEGETKFPNQAIPKHVKLLKSH